MNQSDILIIDGKKFYWDGENESLIPYELIDKNSNIGDEISNEGCKMESKIEIKADSKGANDGLNEFNDIAWEWYMDNYDIDFWENVLGRHLDDGERKLIHGIWNENSLNVDIKMLQKNIIQHHCYIKSITTNIGNCLFESIALLGLGDNDLNVKPSTMIRKNLASLLLSVKTEIGFFPNLPNSTPEEIFLNYNEIEMIKDTCTEQVYVYDYDMMILDLGSNFSWVRLPMEFLLMTISRIYQVEILIYHNKTDYVNKINVWDKVSDGIISNVEIEKIRLGQINEEHYFPLLELTDELKFDTDVINEILGTEIKYDKYINEFKKWSKLMMVSIGISCDENYHDVSGSRINDETIGGCILSDKQDYPIDDDDDDNDNDNECNESIIMKTNKFLTNEQIDDYNQISNFDDFSFV